MKAKDVLETLRISRPTLTDWVKQGRIKVHLLPNGRYEYDDESVYDILNKGMPRMNVIYARVSTSSQKKDLENQIQLLQSFMYSRGESVQRIYQDIASGISFESRKEFFKLLDLIIDHKVQRVFITYKDRLSRVGFGLFKYLFEKYGTEIVVMNEIGSEKLDSQEVFEEIVSLLHCYSMKLYSKRRVANIKRALEEKDEGSES